MPGLFNPSGGTSKKEEEKKSSGGLFKSSAPSTSNTSSGEGGLFKPSSSSTSDALRVNPIFNENPFDTAATERSIANAKLRIQNSGWSANEDKRNRVEKALNLPQDQNWFFDTLDVLNRPQQALFGGMDAILKSANGTPTDRDKAFMDGLTGKQKVRGSDLMQGLGIKNKALKSTLGFVADVATDPLNAVPTKLVGAATNLVGKAGKGTLKGAEAVVPPLKTLRENKIQPALQSGKDALGRIFVPKYKWDETLTGTKDPFLKDRYIQTENDIRYMTDEALRGVTDAARKSGGLDTGTDVGRIMEQDVPLYGPRPNRQLSADPKVQAAADSLVKSNDEIRNWANSNDIPVGEIEGYMRHILSVEEQAARKIKKPNAVDRSFSSMNNPDKKVLESRKLQGSAEDINDMIGRKFFEPNAYFATALGQKKLIEYGNAVKFRREVLSNPNFAEKFIPGQTPAPVQGQVVINTNNYKFLSNPNNVGLADDIGGDYLVTSGVKQALDRYQKISNDEGIHAFLKAYDAATSGWKKLTLLSPEYHVRNDLGAKFNNYIGGMDPAAITKYTTSATVDVTNALARGKETPLFNEFRRQGLGSNSQLAIEFARHGNDAEKALRGVVKDQSRSKLQKGLGVINPLRAFKTSQELGSVIDQINRFALYKWSREVKGMDAGQAAAKVKEVQFDYSDLTPTERELFVRAIPFYRWSRNNIPFQLKKLATDPTRFENVNKLKTETQNYFGMDPNNESEFTKNSLAIPVSGDGKGTGYMLGLNLPAGDLTKLSDPFKLLADSFTPIAKTPAELAWNYDTFRGKEIQQFEGEQKKLQIPDKFFGVNVPGAGTPLGGIPVKQAHAIKQLGGNPARQLFNKLGVKTEREKEEAATKPVLGISNIFKKYDINETNFYEKKRELRELMDLIDYIEQETGDKPKSVRDIKKGL
ncbi:hypothetical protein L1N85_10655 [Paenibacillus alkaliterrae]|uniref:hypothetical protein n=1 Tax=Paenibacillus alkaliterrae TaxID=320909 RepID=UPI001F1DB136|nr:hypothetical protein [Paenibacillus alkaliterrae]MCF2938896.1 hypothetical protein [Paenibacillus alkaliterrae]